MITNIRKKKLLQGISAMMLGFLFVLTGPSQADSANESEIPAKKQDSRPDLPKSDRSTDHEGSEVDLLTKSSSVSISTQEILPARSLTNDLLYQILSADIAEQRGLDVYAYETMLDVAKETADPRLARRAAEIAVKNRNIKDALQAVRLWHKLAPQSEEAEKYLLGFLVLDNRLDEVKDYFSSRLAAATPEKRVALFYQLQQLLAGTKNKSDAFAIMEEVAAPYQDIPEAHLSLAVSALMKNDRSRARDEVQKALVLKPDSEMAVLTYAQVSFNTSEAIDILSAFLLKYPESREVRISLARLLLGQKKYENARQEFEILLNSDPQDLMALYSLGLLSIQENDYISAEKYLERYLGTSSAQSTENRQELIQVLFLLSQIAEEQHRYDESLQWLSRINPDEDDEVALGVEIRKAQIYAKKGNVNRARKIITDLANENPYEREKLLLTEAQILKEVKRTKDAFNVLKSGVAQFPQNTNILYDYALAAENLGKYGIMEESLKRIIEIDPNYQQAYNALGYSLADRNLRLDEAFILIDKAIKLAPDDPYIIDSLGWVFFRQGDLDLAEQNLRHAYKLRSDNEIAIHLAEVLWTKGNRQEALSLFSKVKKKDPDNDLLNSTLTRLKIKL